MQAKKEQQKRQLEESKEEELARERERQWQLAEEQRQLQEDLEERGLQEKRHKDAQEQLKEDVRQADKQKAEELRQQLADQKKYEQYELMQQKDEEAKRLEELREQIKVRDERHIWQLAQDRKELEHQLAAADLERQLKQEAAQKAKEQARLEARVREEDRRKQEEIQRQQRIDQLAGQKKLQEKKQQELKAEVGLKEEVRRSREMEERQHTYDELAQRRVAQLNRLEFARLSREEAEAELKIKHEEKLKAEVLEKLRREEGQGQIVQERLQKEETARQKREIGLSVTKEEAAKTIKEAKAGEEERLKNITEEKKRRSEEAVQKKQEELKILAAARERRERELKAKQGGLAAKEKELQEKLKASALEAVQGKAMTEVMLAKQREDNAKINKIEHLWRKSRKLYAEAKYEEAIKMFQEIIVLEGNPRVKYTPYAKMYLEKAQQKIEEQKKYAAEQNIALMDNEMSRQVLTKQMPPYLEPPQKTEIKGFTDEERLIEMSPVRKTLQKKITLDFDKLDLKTVIAFLSQESGVNIIASQKVLEMGLKVTARFKDTAAEEAVKYITKSLGLIYRIDKDLIWIAHPEEIAKEPLETRVYYLNKGAGLFTEFSPISSGSSSGETSLGGSSAQITKVRTLEDTLKDAIPWPSDSKLVYDKRVNALLARNTPQNLQMLEDILFSVDVTPYQILIEARFIEVEVDDTKEFGLEWQFNNDFALTSASNKGGKAKTVITKNSGVDFSTFARAAEGLNFTYQGLLTNPQFQTVLHALSESKKIKTLSCPRITTLNNQLATMKVVDEWIYPTRYEYEIVQVDLNGDGLFTGAGETTYKNVPKDFLRRDVGILLKVVPSMGSDRKTISLSLIPEVSEGTADGFTYAGDVTLPKFTSRNLSTTVVVQSGDTVVLGGLIKESRTKTTTKVPLLGDVPFLGNFFRKNTDSIARKNLIIFVTAKVLSPSGEEVVMAQKR